MPISCFHITTWSVSSLHNQRGGVKDDGRVGDVHPHPRPVNHEHHGVVRLSILIVSGVVKDDLDVLEDVDGVVVVHDVVNGLVDERRDLGGNSIKIVCSSLVLS